MLILSILFTLVYLALFIIKQPLELEAKQIIISVAIIIIFSKAVSNTLEKVVIKALQSVSRSKEPIELNREIGLDLGFVTFNIVFYIIIIILSWTINAEIIDKTINVRSLMIIPIILLILFDVALIIYCYVKVNFHVLYAIVLFLYFESKIVLKAMFGVIIIVGILMYFSITILVIAIAFFSLFSD